MMFQMLLCLKITPKGCQWRQCSFIVKGGPNPAQDYIFMFHKMIWLTAKGGKNQYREEVLVLSGSNKMPRWWWHKIAYLNVLLKINVCTFLSSSCLCSQDREQIHSLTTFSASRKIIVTECTWKLIIFLASHLQVYSFHYVENGG